LKTRDQIAALRDKARNSLLTLQAVAKWKKLDFSDTPIIFGNAMPKSGSHLVYQILKGLTSVAPFRYVQAKPIRLITSEGRNRSLDEVLSDLKQLDPGVMGWGYLRSIPEIIDYIKNHQEILSFFVYRDPRDQIISSIFYAAEIHEGHAQHDYYRSISMDERIKTEILGRDEPGLLHLPNVRDHYEHYLGWLDCASVLCLKFEDLRLNQAQSLSAILDHIESRGFRIPTPRAKALTMIHTAIQPQKSATFRKGKTGGWREHFTPEHKALFKEISGDLLLRLGYEEDNDW
jgi:hypothetical protein